MFPSGLSLSRGHKTLVLHVVVELFSMRCERLPSTWKHCIKQVHKSQITIGKKITNLTVRPLALPPSSDSAA